MNLVFLDTVGLLALWDQTDQWHQIAAAGIVDQVSFLVMRRLGIQHVFTHDHHFAAAGFEVLF